MKRYLNQLVIAFLGATMLFFSSCLKNNQYYIDFTRTGTLVELPLAATLRQSNYLMVVPYDVTPTPQDLPVYVNIASPNALGTAVSVTLGLDTAALSAYNNANGTSFEVLPDSTYTVSSWKTTVAAGKHMSHIDLMITPTKVDASHSYVLPISILNASGQRISIDKTILYNITVKNKYDGNYGLVIKTVGWSAYGISDNLEGTWPVSSTGTSIGLITSGPSSVKTFDYAAGAGFLQVAFSAGNAGTLAFGNTSPKFTFDPSSNLLIDVSNDVVVDGRNRQFHVNPAVTSRFDPSTKTIYAAYIMTQNGRPPQYIYDTLTYIGPRP